MSQTPESPEPTSGEVPVTEPVPTAPPPPAATAATPAVGSTPATGSAPAAGSAPAPGDATATREVPVTRATGTVRDRMPAWSRYLVVGLAGMVFGGLLGWAITATALHDNGRGDNRGNFRHYGPQMRPGPGFGNEGPGWFRGGNGGRNGAPNQPVQPTQPNQPSPGASLTPSPGATS
jgi:hypothetical protein